MLQGHDTTAAALNFALMELANNKDIQVSTKTLYLSITNQLSKNNQMAKEEIMIRYEL